MTKQNISIGNISMKKSSMNITQTSSDPDHDSGILTKVDFVNELEKVVSTLSAINKKDTLLIDAITDLNDALKEAKKSKPQASVIRRFLNNSTALLNDIKDFVAPAATAVVGLKTLIDVLPQIIK